jgi:hypothetical protein
VYDDDDNDDGGGGGYVRISFSEIVLKTKKFCFPF